jgi:hypothetical protein
MGGALGVMNESNIHTVENAADATVTSGSHRNIVDTVLSTSETIIFLSFSRESRLSLAHRSGPSNTIKHLKKIEQIVK